MKKLFLSLTMILVLCIAGVSLAVDDFTVTETQYTEGTRGLSMIVNDNRAVTNGQNPTVPQSASVKIGGMELMDSVYKSLADDNTPITFCFVVDTTTSYLNGINTIPSEIYDEITSRRDGSKDQYYLITFGTGITKTGPVDYLSESLGNLSYIEAARMNYKDGLEAAAKALDEDDTFSKKVIILVTDGDPEPAVSVDVEQLSDQLAQKGYAVFTCNVASYRKDGQYESNENLKKLIDLSSNTGGLYFRYRSNNTMGRDFIAHILRSGVIRGTISPEYGKDAAGVETAAITLQGTSRMIGQIEAQVSLPVIQGPTPVPTETPMPTETPAPTDTPTVEPTAEPTPMPTEKPGGIKAFLEEHLGENWLLILIAGVLLIVLIVLIILTFTKKKEEPIGGVDPGPDPVPPTEPKRVRVTLKNQQTGYSCETVITEGKPQLFGKTRPGMAPDIVGLGEDSFISRKQFILSYDGENLLLEDANSSNGTFLNNVRINSKVVVTNGNIVRVGKNAGEREFSVLIMQA